MKRGRVLRAVACGLLAAGLGGAVGCGEADMTARPPVGGGGGGGSGGAGASPSSACADIFDQGVVNSYSIDVSPEEWAKIEQEFLDFSFENVARRVYHPAIFRYGDETIMDAQIRLKGQSSRVMSAMLDGLAGKMQFVVAFDNVNNSGRFHGLKKLSFDMPRVDETLLHDRLANNYFRTIGVAAPCTSSARLTINGAYYGVFAAQESLGGRVLEQFFPGNSDGDLFESGKDPDSSGGMPNWPRVEAFWNATDYAAMLPLVDIDPSLREWAVESLMNDGDGYYGGGRNFYIYDQGAKGWVFLPDDKDATFDWLWETDSHPFYFWAKRWSMFLPPGQHYLAVLADPAGRARFVDAMEAELARWNVERLHGWIDTWSAQIAGAVAEDKRKSVTMDAFVAAVARAKASVVARQELIRRFVACQRGTGETQDQDQDGALWCNDCDDANPAVRPDIPEMCGNASDDNCNFAADEGC